MFAVPAGSAIVGDCFNCHTMHEGGVNGLLSLESCLSCHAQGESQALLPIGEDQVPQVNHTDPAADLAGGNFAYITGEKGSGALDSKGHNIAELTGQDTVLFAPPGGINQFGHNDGYTVNSENLTCAGTNGCHGFRLTGDPSRDGIIGAHHNDVDGRLILADTKGNSYRFLAGVKGYESPDWEYISGPDQHNEYFGLTEPLRFTCSGAKSCHSDGEPPGVIPPDGTISQFCATCHGNFHTLDSLDSEGVGRGQGSPFIRHPTDLALPELGEYAQYTSYSLEAPVARTGTLPAAPDSGVVPGSDAVMCLSCHRAHASNYPSMLRWDYDRMIAGGGGADGTGCFVCHASKDN